MSDRCLKIEAQALFFKVWSRKYFVEVYIDSQFKIVIIYL